MAQKLKKKSIQPNNDNWWEARHADYCGARTTTLVGNAPRVWSPPAMSSESPRPFIPRAGESGTTSSVRIKTSPEVVARGFIGGRCTGLLWDRIHLYVHLGFARGENILDEEKRSKRGRDSISLEEL